MELKIDTNQLSAATKEVMGLSELFKKAERSALESTGWMVSREMRAFVESSGGGAWASLHPMTSRFNKKYKTGTSKWSRSRKADGPMHWLGKFSRYSVDDDAAVIGFGKSREGEKGTIDPFLMSVLRRAAEGEKTAVSASMRRFFGATRWSNSKRQMAGETFFPLRKGTTVLYTPKRPIFDPVMDRIQSMIMPWFEDKFWLAVERHKTGVNNKT